MLKDFFKITIGKRIALGFATVLLVIVISNLYSYSVLNSGIDQITHLSKDVEPNAQAITDFQLLIFKTKLYAGSWAFQRSNQHDRDALKKIKESSYDHFKQRLTRLYNDTTHYSLEELDELHKVQAVMKKYEITMDEIEVNIMNKLTQFEDYDDEDKMYEVSHYVESDLNRQLDGLIKELEIFNKTNIAHSIEVRDDMKGSFQSLGNLIWILCLAVGIIAIIISYFTTKVIRSNVDRLKKSIDSLMKGEIPPKVDIKTKDEVGEMGSAVNQLIDGLNNYSTFALKIGDGDFDSKFNKLGENDIIGTSLLSMRDSLKMVSDEDNKRNWSTKGLTEISTILRNEAENLDILSYNVVRGVVNYMNINQGGIYIAEKNERKESEYDGFETLLRMTGCFAYDRDKLVNKIIVPGEGLIGQCWLEQKFIVVTEVPEEYIRITSGLGEATPKAVICVPLAINEEIYGVIELASFKQFEPHEIEFANKIGEIIASSISNVKNNEMTQQLLLDSKELTNSLQAQDEELRQNQEEMLATQEEATRKYQESVKELNANREEMAQVKSELEKAKADLEKAKNKG